MSVSRRWTLIGVLLVIGIDNICECIDPEYSLDNRVGTFLNASLNTILTVMKLDERPIHEDVTFWCMNREHRNLTQTTFNEKNFRQNIDFTKPLVFIVHGWYDSHNRTWIREMTDTYLLFQDINICITDWQRLALQSYAISATNTKKVGLFLGRFIKRLNNAGMPYDGVSIVGHSFGSHIAGYAGAYVGGKIKAIYGLDPAGPRFAKKRLNPPNERLDPTDARFVQVIHTDKENIGTAYDMGHQDFYPNDGASPMPGCFAPSFQSGIHMVQFFCSHFKAVEYFTAALNPNHQFIAQNCGGDFDNYVIGLCDQNQSERFGIYAKRRARGRFYLMTAKNPPYAMGRSRRRRTSSNSLEEWQKQHDRDFVRQGGVTKNGLILNFLTNW